MKIKLVTLVSVAAVGVLLRGDAARDKDDHADKKVVGTLVVEAGHKMPFRISFVDRKAAEEKRVTKPVSVTVDQDGKFEIPKLSKLPEGYLLTTFPCTKLKAVTVSGVDLRTPQSAEAAKLGNASTIARSVQTFSDFASSVLGGVKYSDCGGEK